ncbi:hypothetical protein B0H12DRAFT_1229453 [Mycena haematopus]|nr:hypothetical protein B0H12DRAFT_1229453 [Mycena haematopus]
MLHSTIRLSTLWNTVVKINPTLTRFIISQQETVAQSIISAHRSLNKFFGIPNADKDSQKTFNQGPDTPAMETSTPVNKDLTSIKRTRFEEVGSSSKHGRKPATHRESPRMKSTSVRESRLQRSTPSQRDVERSIVVSEMGELVIRSRIKTRTNRYSRIKALVKSWTMRSPQAARLKLKAFNIIFLT